MDKWIVHPREPQRLILSWEAPPQESERMRWAVGEVRINHDRVTFRYFRGTEFGEMNCGKCYDDLKAVGYLGYPAFETKGEPGSVFKDHVLEAFLRRLPPLTRSDLPQYLERFRLRSVEALSPLSLLGITEARLPSDGFSLIDPLDDATSCFELVMEVAGHRHYRTPGNNLLVGQQVEFCPEPSNEHDRNALRVDACGEPIGYINRLQAVAVGRMLQSRTVQGWVLRLNGTPDRPRAYLFMQIRPLEQHVAA